MLLYFIYVLILEIYAMSLYVINGIKLNTAYKGRLKKYWVATTEICSKCFIARYVAKDVTEEKAINSILWRIINKEVNTKISSKMECIT